MKISIITINYNNVDGLRQTMLSVLNQKYTNYEYIIIDGGSIDESFELVKQNTDQRIKFIYEKDTGIFNAMNKGIKLSLGNYLLFVNSGDVMYNDEVISSFLENCQNEDIIYGDLIVKDKLQTNYIQYPDSLTFNQLYNKSIPHSGGSFIKKELFTKQGEFDEKYKIVSDWKFFIQALVINGATYRHISKPFAIFNLDGISSRNNTQMQLERSEVLKELIPDLILKDYQSFNSTPKDYNAESVFSNTNKYYLTRMLLKSTNKLALLIAKITSK